MDWKAFADTLASDRTIVADDRPALAASDAAPTLQRGQCLGRYVILERLGAGGMGVVYAAFDPELDRKVAIKILGRPGDAPADSVGAARLLREAKALARLAHPNVVGVHDAGAEGGRVFVAMEFVPGVTLRDYLFEKTFPWRRALELYVAAGRGLAAAHGAGLVHRDFKPDNVLVGDDGRVRVLDFGLARVREREPDEAGKPPEDISLSGLTTGQLRARIGALSGLDSKITRDGSLVGTPAYMAPEQFLGRPLDARSDQFSFCVSLWEALYGQHPFGEGTPLALMQAITRGRLRPIPRDRRTPAWLPKVLARGLLLSPKRRWPDMNALLAELERRAYRGRRWRIGGAIGLGVGLLLGTGLWGYALSDRGPASCQGASLRLAGVWDAARRDAVEAAFRAADRPHARATWDRVAAGLDAYAAAWSAMHTDACLATHARGEQSADLLDLRMTCLGERRRELGALTELLAGAGPEVVDRAVQAVAALTPLARCADVPALTAQVPPPPDDPALAERIAAIRGQLAEVKARLDAGRLASGRELAEVAAGAAESVGWRPLVAEADYALGLLQNRVGEPKSAEAALERAALGATANKLDDVAARAMVELIACVGLYQSRFDEALRWSALAEAMVARLGPEGHVLEAKRLVHTGLVAQERGDYRAARGLHERALALLDRPERPDASALVGALSNLGNTLADLGLHAEAIERQRRAVALAEEIFGPDHPQLALLQNNLGAVLHDLGHDDEAAEIHARALAIKERALGPKHLSVAASLRNLAGVRVRQGELAEAQAMLRRALAIREETLGLDHPDAAEVLCDLGEISRRQGRYPLAQALLARALAIVERFGGPTHPRLSPILAEIGRTLADMGRPADAVAPLQRALEIERASRAPNRPLAAAELRLALADVLWDSHSDRARALALVGEARDLLRDTGDSLASARATVDRWLAEHPLERGR